MRRGVAGVALGAGAAAVLVAAVPGLVGPLRDALGGVPPGVLIGLLVLLGLALVWRSGRRARRLPEPEPLVPDRSDASRAPAVGEGFDDRLDRVTDPDLPRERRLPAQDDVRERVRELAVTACRTAADCDRAAAERAVAVGAWTDDPRASALAGGPEAPAPPLHVRLWDLVRAESAFRRRVRHALGAVRAVQRGERDPGVEAVEHEREREPAAESNPGPGGAPEVDA